MDPTWKFWHNKNILTKNIWLILEQNFDMIWGGLPRSPPNRWEFQKIPLEPLHYIFKSFDFQKVLFRSGWKLVGCPGMVRGYTRYQRFQKLFILCKNGRVCHAVNIFKHDLFWSKFWYDLERGRGPPLRITEISKIPLERPLRFIF